MPKTSPSSQKELPPGCHIIRASGVWHPENSEFVVQAADRVIPVHVVDVQTAKV